MPQVVFVLKDGTRRAVAGEIGQTLLEVAHAWQIDIEGACGGAMACSTCHVVVDPSWYGKLRPASDDENDMLDLAAGLTKTSRLGCQIRLAADMDGLTVRLPPAVKNLL